MRRAQVDAGSQPVRNMWTNPSFETLTGGTGICRTNSCINPRGVNSFAAYGSQTITPNVTGFPAHPEGITTANRVQYDAGSGNPGVLLFSPAAVGTTYTISAWIYHETIPTSGTQGFAQQGVASMGSPPAFVQGTWQRFSWTYTSTSTAGLGFRVSAPGSAGSFLITGALVELNSVLGTFFDGATAAAGDFTYQWTGTVNASTSQQRGQSVTGINAGGSAPIQSTEWSASGSKSIRIISNSTTNDTRASLSGDTGAFQMGLQAGKTYTVSGFIRLAAAQVGTLHTNARRIMFFYRNAAGTYIAVNSNQAPNAVGVTRCVVTMKIPSDATEAFIRLMNGASAQNGEVWWDNVMVVEGEYVGDYVDGTKPLSKWDGAANASTSVGYPPQLLDIAGKPAVDMVNVAQLTNVAMPVGPLTVYTVQSMSSDSNSPGFWEIVNSNASWVHATGIVRWIAQPEPTLRFDHVTDPSGSVANNITGYATRLSVLALAADPTGTGTDAQVNGGTTITRAASATYRAIGAGAYMRVGSRDGVTQSVTVTTPRLLVYQGKHNLATRQAISRYLGNKYGVNVA